MSTNSHMPMCGHGRRREADDGRVMPGRGGEMRCTACSWRAEFCDGGDIDDQGREFHYEHMVCSKCVTVRNVIFHWDRETQRGAPASSPARCSTSSCRRVLRPWNGTIAPDGVEGPCPACESPVVESEMEYFWD